MSRADEPNPAQAGGQGKRRRPALRSANLAVRLLCELGLLIALAGWGFHTGSGAGAAALAAAGYLLVAVVFAAVVAANIILVRMLE